MTPRETLEKYGLKTDVKSIRERMEGNLGLYLGIIDHHYPLLSHETREKMADEIYTADLSLLCELAEKGEELAERDQTNAVLPSDEGAYIGVCPACGWNLEWAENIRRDYWFCPQCGQRLKGEPK